LEILNENIEIAVPPAALFLLTIIFHIALEFRPKSGVLWVLVIFVNIVFSLLAWIYNVMFIVDVSSFDSTIGYLGVILLSFSFICAVSFVCLLLFLHINGLRQIPKELLLRFVVMTILGLADISSFHHFRDLPTYSEEVVDALRLGKVFLQYTPLIILQFASFSVANTPVFVASLFYNGLELLSIISFELAKWTREARSPTNSSRPKSGSILQVPLLDRDDAQQLEEEEAEERGEGEPTEGDMDPGDFDIVIVNLPRSHILTYAAIPLLLISILPQTLTILGLPFCFAVVRRYLLACKDSQVDSSQARGLSWFEMRGYSLVIVNMLSFMIILMILLPFGSVTEVFFYVIKLAQRRKGSWGDARYHQVRDSLHSLLGKLAYALLPFLSNIPRTRLPKPSIVCTPSFLMRIALVLWFVGWSIVAPLVSLTTGFQYSAQLLMISEDEVIQDRQALVAWVNTSFFACSIGLIMWISGLIFDVTFYLREYPRTWAGLSDLSLSFSPLGRPNPKAKYPYLKRLITVIFEDTLQILVMCFTLSYVGQENALWVFKVITSVVSCAFGLAKVSVALLFGLKTTRPARVGLQAVYFFFFASGLFLFVAITASNNFCTFSRTVNNGATLAELGGCPSISAETIFITEFVGEYGSATIVAATITATVNITLNSAPLNFTFRNSESLESDIIVGSNTGDLSVIFSALDTITNGTSLTVSDNSNLIVFEVPVLHYIATGGSLTFVDNKGQPSRDFYGLSTISGTVAIHRNTFFQLNFDLLEFVGMNGKVLITGNPQVQTIDMDTLMDVDGVVLIAGNPSLQSLSFSSLTTVAGTVNIVNNTVLQSLAVPNFVSGSLTLNITDNPNLKNITFPKMESFSGNLFITGNLALESIRFPNLTTLASGSSLSLDSDKLYFVSLCQFSCSEGVNIYLNSKDNVHVHVTSEAHSCITRGSSTFDMIIKVLSLCY